MEEKENPGFVSAIDVSSQKVNVAVRLRSLIPAEVEKKCMINWSATNHFIQQVDPTTGFYVPNVTPHPFDHVFGTDTKTQDVYDRVVSPIVQDALRGFNGTVLCYGQTSSGKTFTLYGDDKEEGIISLTANALFKHIQDNSDRQYIIRVGLIEVYNENVTDLLNSENPIKIIEQNGEVILKDLEEIEIVASELLKKAAERVQRERKIGETRMNKESSRSHTILRIAIESFPKNDFLGNEEFSSVTKALLNFVDLAGSEKAHQTGATGSRLKEASFINKSLSTLSQVVMQLSEASTDNMKNVSIGVTASVNRNKPRHISFRDSKLTRILQSSLGGNAYIAMICNITPAYIDETLSTLRFAKTAKKIQTKPVQNHLRTDKSELEKIIVNLQAQLDGKGLEVMALRKKLAILSCEGTDVGKTMMKPPNSRRQTVCPGMLDNHRIRDFNVNDSPQVFKSLDNNPNLMANGNSHAVDENNGKSSLSPGFTNQFMSDTQAIEHFAKLAESRVLHESSLKSEAQLVEMSCPGERRKGELSPGDEPAAKKIRFQKSLLDDTPKTSLLVCRSLLATVNEDDKKEFVIMKKFMEDELELKGNVLSVTESKLEKQKAESEEIRKELEKTKEMLATKEWEFDSIFKESNSRAITIKQLNDQLSQINPHPTNNLLDLPGTESSSDNQDSSDRIENLHEKIRALETQVKETSLEKDFAHKEVVDLKEELERQTTRNKCHEKAFESLQSQLKRKDTDLAGMEDEKLKAEAESTQLKNQLTEKGGLKSQNEKLLTELSALKNSMEENSKNLQNVMKEKEMMVKGLSELKEAAAKELECNTHLTSQINVLNLDLSNQKDELIHLEKVKDKQEELIEAIKEKKFEAEAQIVQLQSKQGELQSKNEKLKTEISQFMQSSQCHSDQFEKMKSELEFMNERYSKLKESSGKRSEDFKIQVDSLNVELNYEKAKSMQFADVQFDLAQMREFQTEREKLLTEKCELENSLKKEMLELRENSVKELEDLKSQSDSTTVQLQEKLMRLEKEKKELEEEKEKKNEPAAYNEQLKSFSTQIEKLRTENEKLLNEKCDFTQEFLEFKEISAKEMEDLKLLASYSDSANLQLQQELTRLGKQKKEAELRERESEKREEEAEALITKLTSLGAEIEELQTEIEKLLNAKCELTKCLQDQREKFEQMENDKETMKKEFLELRESSAKELEESKFLSSQSEFANLLFKQELMRLEEEKKELEMRMDTVEKSNEAGVTCIAELESKLAQLSAVQCENENFIRDIYQVKEKLKVQSEINNSVKQEKENISREYAEWRENAEKLLEECQMTFTSQLGSITLERNTTQEKLVKLEEEMKDLEEEKKTIERNNEQAVDEMAALQNQLAATKRSYDLLTEMHSMEFDDSQSSSKINELGAKLESSESIRNECEVLLARMQSTLKERDEQIEILQLRLENQRPSGENEDAENVKDLQKELESLAEKLKRIAREKEELEKECSIKSQRIEILELESQQIVSQLESQQISVSQLETTCDLSIDNNSMHNETINTEVKHWKLALLQLEGQMSISETEKENLTRELSIEQEKLAKSRSEVAQLQSQLEIQTDDMGILNDLLETRTAHFNQLETVRKELDSEVPGLKMELEGETAEYERMKVKKEELEGELSHLYVKLAEQSQSCYKFKTDIEEFSSLPLRNAELEEIEALKDKFEKEISRLEDVNGNVNQSLETFKMERANVEMDFSAQKKKLEEEVEKSGKLIKTLTYENEELEITITLLREEIQKQENVQKTWDVERQNHSSTLDKNKECLNLLLKEKEELRINYDFCCSEYKRNSEDLSKCQKELVDKTKESAESQGRIDSLREDVKSGQEELNTLQSRLEQLLNSAKTADSDRATMEQVIKNFQSHKKNQTDFIESLQQEKNSAEDKLVEKTNFYCKQMKETQEKLKMTEKELKAKIAEVSSKDGEMQSKDVDIRKKSEEMECLKVTRTQLHGHLQQLGNQIASLESKLKEAGEKVDRFQMDNNHLICRNTELQERVKNMTENLAEVSKPIQVNRQTMTGDSVDVMAELKKLKVRTIVMAKDLRKAEETRAVTEKSHTKEIDAVKLDLTNCNAECEKLKTTICILEEEKEALTNSKRSADSGIQCDLLSDLYKRSLNGEKDLLPFDLSEVSGLRSEISYLKGAKMNLEQGRIRCVCEKWREIQIPVALAASSSVEKSNSQAEKEKPTKGINFQRYVANLNDKDKETPSRFLMPSSRRKYNLRSTESQAPPPSQILPSSSSSSTSSSSSATNTTAVHSKNAVESKPKRSSRSSCEMARIKGGAKDTMEESKSNVGPSDNNWTPMRRTRSRPDVTPMESRQTRSNSATSLTVAQKAPDSPDITATNAWEKKLQ